jgi:hypothetical protein
MIAQTTNAATTASAGQSIRERFFIQGISLLEQYQDEWMGCSDSILPEAETKAIKFNATNDDDTKHYQSTVRYWLYGCSAEAYNSI